MAPERVELVARAVGLDATGEAIPIEGEWVGAEYRGFFQPQALWPDHLGHVRLTATFTAPALEEQRANLDFYFTAESRIPGRLLGHAGDRLVEGLPRVEVAVLDAGGVDARGPGPLQAEGVQPVREHDREIECHRSFGRAIDERLKIASGSGNEYRGFAG